MESFASASERITTSDEVNEARTRLAIEPTASNPANEVDEALLRQAVQYTAKSLLAGPLASIAAYLLLRSTPFRAVEMVWAVLHGLTAVLTTAWCSRVTSTASINRESYRFFTGLHVLTVVSMPIWFSPGASSKRSVLEVVASLVATVLVVVMTAPDRSFSYAILTAAVSFDFFGFEALEFVPLPVRIVGACAAFLGFAPVIEAVHRPQRQTIELAILNRQLVADLQTANRALAAQVETDPLTGLGNRLAMQNFLTEPRPIGLLYVDVDHFKEVNDRRGHAAGDAVLRRLGDLLRIHVRDGDLVARLGGDEFVMLLNDASIEEANEVAERLRRDVGDAFAAEGVTVSIGGTTGDLRHERSDELFARADANLYVAKNGGKNAAFIIGSS